MAEHAWSFRAYRRLLRLYPAQFRQDYEREILLTYRSQWQRERSPGGRLACFVLAAAGVLCNAPQEHFHMMTNDLRYALRTFRGGPGLRWRRWPPLPWESASIRRSSAW